MGDILHEDLFAISSPLARIGKRHSSIAIEEFHLHERRLLLLLLLLLGLLVLLFLCC